MDSKDPNHGFDAQTELYVDMIEAGIVDPAKVVRTALQDAGSIAALLITAEAMIADIPQKDEPAWRQWHGREWATDKPPKRPADGGRAWFGGCSQDECKMSTHRFIIGQSVRRQQVRPLSRHRRNLSHHRNSAGEGQFAPNTASATTKSVTSA